MRKILPLAIFIFFVVACGDYDNHGPLGDQGDDADGDHLRV